ncbi:MAG: hypothetical protein ACYC09_00370 [Bacteroidota bacterium]
MKSIITILLFIILSGNTAFSQNTDSASVRNKKTEQKKFTDQNADGVPDAQQKKKLQRRDTFIDANGDGICDSREQGLGFKRNGKYSGNTAGTKTGPHRGGKK